MSWILRRGPAARPIAEFLAESAHMTFEWSADRGRARRFASKGEAERFGRNLLASACHPVPA